MAPKLSNDGILRIVFMANYIGIVCARSLHYQFYSWYDRNALEDLFISPFVSKTFVYGYKEGGIMFAIA